MLEEVLKILPEAPPMIGRDHEEEPLQIEAEEEQNDFVNNDELDDNEHENDFGGLMVVPI